MLVKSLLSDDVTRKLWAFFERYLTLWVALCIAAGVLLGNIAPQVFAVIATLEYAHVNLVVAVFIWIMIYPMMVQIDFSAIKEVGRQPKGLILTLVINWLIKPFSMALIGWLFFRVLFDDWVDPQSAGEYIAGMILLGVAPCTAMVFVWSQLTRGDPNYTLVQVSVNDVIMIFAFAPLTAFLLGRYRYSGALGNPVVIGGAVCVTAAAGRGSDPAFAGAAFIVCV